MTQSDSEEDGSAPGGRTLPGHGEPDTERADSVREEEFSCFYRGHIVRLVAYLIYQGASAHLAADLAQDAMATAYRRWHDIISPRAYVWAVVYRAFLRHELNDPFVPAANVPESASLLPRPGDAEEWLQEQQVIEVLKALPPRQRQVLALWIDGWSSAETAELLDIDPSAVRSSLMKARRSAAGHIRRLGREDS